MSKSSHARKSMKVRPDSKGRITLGRFAEGISSFVVMEQPGGCLLLEPMVEVHAHEEWLFKNEAALSSVKRGLLQSSQGEVKSRGSFAKYAEDTTEEPSEEKDE